MSANGDEIEISPVIFQDLANLEKKFAVVELDALRRKEYALKSLYAQRSVLLNQLPQFWPQVLINGPQEFQSCLSDSPSDSSVSDAEIIALIKSVNVERYQITSETEGEPRSLRFTFEFNENDIFEDEKVVKEFEFVKQTSTTDEDDEEDEAGVLISKPVGFKWKKGSKKAKAFKGGLLDLAVDLYHAEEAVKLKNSNDGQDLRVVDRETLWQYEKLRSKMEKMMEEEEEEEQGSFLDWFGFRGAVGKSSANGGKKDRKNGGGADDDGLDDLNIEEMMDDEDDGMLDVEIFPAGEEVAIALADDLWPNVMDYFMAAQSEGDDFDGLSDDDDEANSENGNDEIPELVEAEEVDETKNDRPNKRQRRS